MPIESILALAAAVFIFSLKPGPGILTAMTCSMSHGFSGLIAFIAGFNIGLGIYLAIVFVGIMGISSLELDLLFLAILAKSLAAIYLISIGVKEFITRNDETEIQLKTESAKRMIDIVSSAVILTISNPMVIVFYASIIPVFIAPESINVSIALVISAMLMVIDSFGMIIYCAPLILFRRKIPSSFMSVVKGVSAILIIMIGIYIGYTALPANDIISLL